MATTGSRTSLYQVKFPTALVTYGSYMLSHNQVRGCAAPYVKTEYRSEPWRASHLKTCRAGLFHRIDERDLKDDRGEYLQHAADHAIMFPLMEMAGPERVVYVEPILYVYHYDESFEARASADAKAEADAIVKLVRQKKPYARLREEEW